jgi:hypothetical protein
MSHNIPWDVIEPYMGTYREIEYNGSKYYFFIDEIKVRYHHSCMDVFEGQWYYLSSIHWGQGKYSTLYVNSTGELKVVEI